VPGSPLLDPQSPEAGDGPYILLRRLCRASRCFLRSFGSFESLGWVKPMEIRRPL
jgi:hypothetical protein